MRNSGPHLVSRSIVAICVGVALSWPIASYAALIDIDISGRDSFSSKGDPLNDILTIDLSAELGEASGTPVDVTGIGFDVTIEALNPSWLSEATLLFSDGAGTEYLEFAPGLGDDNAGLENYSTSGVLDFADIFLGPEFTLTSGVLQIEFYESFDDFPGFVDAYWIEGSTLTLKAFASGDDRNNNVPAPSSLLLLSTGFLIFLQRHRRRSSFSSR